MVFETTGAAEAFLLARVLFGAILVFMGMNHLFNVDQMAGYAQSKGIPAARFSVVASGVQLAAGGLAIAAGAFPVLGAGAVAVFLLVATPTMHDFWRASDEEVQAEMTNFLKNVALLGGVLAFLAIGSVEWPYALRVGLF